MKEPEWLNMMKYRQELHSFCRVMLAQEQHQTLTASEQELLCRMYLSPEESTPRWLSQSTGMKKEAVSRCLRALYEKDCIEKKRHPQDERSYLLSLTETGRAELERSCRTLLNPLYELKRRMGVDFEQLFQLVEAANEEMGQ